MIHRRPNCGEDVAYIRMSCGSSRSTVFGGLHVVEGSLWPESRVFQNGTSIRPVNSHSSSSRSIFLGELHPRRSFRDAKVQRLETWRVTLRWGSRFSLPQRPSNGLSERGSSAGSRTSGGDANRRY